MPLAYPSAVTGTCPSSAHRSRLAKQEFVPQRSWKPFFWCPGLQGQTLAAIGQARRRAPPAAGGRASAGRGPLASPSSRKSPGRAEPTPWRPTSRMKLWVSAAASWRPRSEMQVALRPSAARAPTRTWRIESASWTGWAEGTRAAPMSSGREPCHSRYLTTRRNSPRMPRTAWSHPSDRDPKHPKRPLLVRTQTAARSCCSSWRRTPGSRTRFGRPQATWSCDKPVSSPSTPRVHSHRRAS
mmetsp:Transcript_26112/g.81440  ORF Transcript_26112/g.81440 Transcript_26112/m.81440 type:complete len:241 (+) Transcript_26112:360-1082(+)